MQYNVTFRQKDKGWQAIVSYKEGGKWRQRSKQGFPSKKDAKEAADAIIEGLKKENTLCKAPELRNMTLGAFMSVFYRDMKGKIRGSTLSSYKSALVAFSPLWVVKMKDITPHMVSSCLDDKRISALSKATYLAKLSRVYVYAGKYYNIVNKNPCTNVMLPKANSHKLKILEPEELDRLLAESWSFGPKIHLGILISACTGLRLGEVAGLRWDDIDLENGLISVKRQLAGYNHGDGRLCQPKTASSIRTVPIPPRLIEAIRAFPDREGQIFVPHDRKRMARAVSSLTHVTFHALRHTFATTLIAHGVDIKTVAALLGDKMETVMNTYIHYTDDMRKSAARDIEKIFG